MTKGRANSLRRQGWATGSVYGHNSQSVSVEVDLRGLSEQVKGSGSGMKSLIDLKIEGAPNGSDGQVIIKGIAKDPITRKTLDVQFQRVYAQEKINTSVPIVITGDSPCAERGGIIEQELNELQINCLPEIIPPVVNVDVSDLGPGHHISIKNLDMGSGIEILTDPETVVVTCVAHRTPGGK